MKRLFLSSFLVAFGVALAIFFVNMYWRDRVIADGERVLQSRASAIANAVDVILQRRMTQVFTFAALPSVRGYATSDVEMRPARTAILYAELQAMVSADPNVRAATVVDRSGFVGLTTDKSMLADWSERVFVREALRGQLYASPPSLDFGEACQFYSAPILDNKGDVSGALVLRVTAQEWWQVLNDQSNIRVVDEYGVRLADKSATPLTFSALAPLAPDLKARLLAEKRYGSELDQINATNLKSLAEVAVSGSDWKVFYRELDGHPARAVMQRLHVYPWNVIVFEYDHVLTEQVDYAWRIVLVMGTWVFVVTAFSGWMVFVRRKVD